MAQKFGNSRWVKEGFLDNHKPGLVIGQMTFAALGNVDFCLQGDLRGEIEGQGIRFHNPQFIDDERAADSLFDFAFRKLGRSVLCLLIHIPSCRLIPVGMVFYGKSALPN